MLSTAQKPANENRRLPFFRTKRRRMDRRLVLLSHRHRFAWVQVPKVASTTLKALLERSHGVAAADDGYRPISNDRLAGSGLEYRVVGQRGLDRVVRQHPDYFFFCFVRNPYARLLSGYRNKLSRYARRYHPLTYLVGKTQALAGKTQAMASLGRGDSLFDRLSQKLPFERFANDLRRHGNDFDDHFRSQLKIVRADDTPYARVGRIESFDEDMAEIARAVGLRIADTPKESSGQRLNATGAGQTQLKLYTPEAREAAYEVYRSDFERFGYAA